jgi:hypothetical protein
MESDTITFENHWDNINFGWGIKWKNDHG